MDDSITNDPYPHGEVLRVSSVLRQPAGDYAEEVFACAFELSSGTWRCIFLDEAEQDTHLFGVGHSPKAAFESLIGRHTIANGGIESRLLRRWLPFMRDHFDEGGDFHPEMLTYDKNNIPASALHDWTGIEL